MMSTPRSSSALMGDASNTAGCGTTGRRLANRPNALRSPKRPCSGRTLAAGLDHFGPPTAPKSTASARSAQAPAWPAGSASPVASMAAPPSSADSNSKAWPKRAATAASTRTASAVTSPPMPSPGRTAINAFIGRGPLRNARCRSTGRVDSRVHRRRGAGNGGRKLRWGRRPKRRSAASNGLRLKIDVDFGARIVEQPS